MMFGLDWSTWLILALANIPLYAFLVWVIFDDIARLIEALKYAECHRLSAWGGSDASGA